MELGMLQQYGDDAPVWVFGAARALTPAECDMIRRELGTFVRAWAAHGETLDAACDVLENRFVVVVVADDKTASGCAIDKLFQAVGALERAIGTSLLDSSIIWYRDADGTIVSTDRTAFAARADHGEVNAGTTVFDLAVTTLGMLKRSIERPAGASWHRRYLPNLATA